MFPVNKYSVFMTDWNAAFNAAKGVTVDALVDKAGEIMSERHDYRVATPYRLPIGNQRADFQAPEYTPAQVTAEEGENTRFAAKVSDVTRFYGNQVAIGINGMASLYNLEENAFVQLGRKLGAPFFGPGSRNGMPREYMQHMGKVNPALYEQIMNYHVGLYPNGGYIRTHGDNVTAWMGSDYVRMDADDMLGLLQTVMREAGPGFRAVPIQPRIWRDGMDISFLTHIKDGKDNTGNDDGDGSHYAHGFTMSTGHTGNMSVQIAPFTMRGACTNTARYSADSGVKFKHTGSREARLTSMYTAIMDAMKVSGELYDNMLAARRVRLDLAACAQKMKDSHDLTDDFFTDMMIGSEGKETLWGLSNGITFAVQRHEMTIEERIKLETVAGTMLDSDLQPDWLRKAIKKAEEQVMVAVR